MNNKSIKKFELDPKTVKVKELLNKDFLELEIKAISTANPNRNGSAFSRESLENAIETFYNKPILGSFSVNQDDFRAHEGELSYDEDYEQLYYDYTDEISETPLGMIRGDDTVKIVHDKKDGLDWLVFTCAIWVKYNYKQVKKLLKSKDGHKKISVEVEVTDSEFDEDGIEQIKSFVFDGCTILGDKYETGIADAQMTILDMVDNALFQKQQKCLAFAYDKLDKQNVETPDEATALDKDSNIQFAKEENPVDNEETPQVSMDENENQEGGDAMPEEKDKKEQEACEEKEQEACETCEEKTEESCGEKDTQSCEDVEVESCDGEAVVFEHEEGGEGEGHKCIECTIHDLMISENEAIEEYSHAEHHFAEEFPLIAKIFHEIKEEEEAHLGELTQALQMINDETIEHLEEGIEEAKEIVAEEILEEQQEGEAEQEFAIHDEDGDGEDNHLHIGEEPDQRDKEKEPEEDKPENVEAPKDNKGDDANDFAEEPKDDDNDEKDDKDEDDDDDDDVEDEDNKEEFGNSINPDAEPLNVDVDGQTMSEIVTNATESIKAPEVVTQVEEMGTANAGVAEVLDNVQQEVVEGDPDGTANEDGSPINPDVVIKQPDDAQKERDKQFVSDAETSINVEELLKKYNELEEKFNQLNNAKKAEEAEKLIKFGTEFINADEVVDEEAKKEYIAQVEEKCNAYEFTTEEEVTKFAKGLMAMYYYENQAVRKENNSEEFSLTLTKPARVNNGASNKLKDAINKLNYLNKEE